VEISHSYVGDLVVSLRSPAGTEVTLLDRPGYPNLSFGCSDTPGRHLRRLLRRGPRELVRRDRPWYSGTARLPGAVSLQQSVERRDLEPGGDRLGGGRHRHRHRLELITTPALSGTCQTCGGPAEGYTYLVGGISHAPGAAGTNWRSKLAVLNRSGASAEVTLDYVRTSRPAPRP